MPKVLLVDDEPSIIEFLEIALLEEGMDVLKACCGRDALKILNERPVDVVISDILMPDISGVELLREAGKIVPDTAFILITAFAGPETAIEALQYGACDYITKPFRIEDLCNALNRALQKKVQRSSQTAEAPVNLEAQQGKNLFQALHEINIVGKSPRMLEVYRTIGAVAMGDSTVLITGESGTGKELVAKAIHEASRRKEKPFVSINCGAFPETLLESELFGYMKGAFTGASANKKGLFEAANGGSIFLDEIGEMTLAMQVKLLRVLQERRVRPLGGTGEIPIDVRVIAATNRNLPANIQDGAFREDLYYRIAVINIQLPALRERVDDIQLLAYSFLNHYAEKSGRSIAKISPEAMRSLENYDWPGNVRQLENVIERAVALATSNTIHPEQLPDTILRHAARARESAAGQESVIEQLTEAVQFRSADDPGKLFTLPEGPFDLEAFLNQVESSLLSQALRQSDGNQTLAAQRLNLTKGSLRHRLQTLQVRP